VMTRSRVTDHQDQLATQNEELRAAQEELEESRNRYADLYDSAPVGYVSLSAAGRIEEINLTGAVMLGRSRERLTGVPFHRFVRDRNSLEKFLAHLRECRRMRSTVSTRIELDAPGGTLPVELRSRPQPDRSLLVLTTILDLTQQARAEEARIESQQALHLLNQELEQRVRERTAALEKSETLKQTVFDAIPAQIVVLNAQGEIIECNRAWEKNAGAESSAFGETGGNGSNYLEICRRCIKKQQGAAEAGAGIEAVLRGHLQQFQTEYHRLSGSERERWFAVTATPLAGGAGAVVLHEDVTARKILEREILEISEAERRRVGQDLHDSLSQHLGGTALMAGALATSLARAHLPESEEALQIAGLIRIALRQTRELARGLHPVELDAQGLVSALQELAQSVTGRVSCECRCPGELAITNNEVAVNLYRIAQESVANALKHGHPRKIVIMLKQAARYLVLTIEDDGPGLKPLNDSANGMGLHIMRYRASSLGAKLEIGNRLTGGARVRCSLPLEKAQTPTRR
ncbi:MAG: PAS domain-containing protein, partial [Verrucomicrobiota bacterium]|nr:PAS domain-containing protein [Verrucomicrobiota bacterium]